MSHRALTPSKPGSSRRHYERLDPEARREYQRKGNLSRYGITPAEYDAMLERQGGVCAICGREETRRANHGGKKRLAVDHNHNTGKVRGLLCHLCNIGIGHFEDDLGRLRAAMAYLEENT